MYSSVRFIKGKCVIFVDVYIYSFLSHYSGKIIHWSVDFLKSVNTQTLICLLECPEMLASTSVNDVNLEKTLSLNN